MLSPLCETERPKKNELRVSLCEQTTMAETTLLGTTHFFRT